MAKGPTRRHTRKGTLRTSGDNGRSEVIASQGLGAWRKPASTFRDGHDRARSPKHKKQHKQDWAGE